MVVKVKSPVLVKIFTGRRQFFVHHNSLKLCKETELPIWLLRARNDMLKNKCVDNIQGEFDYLEDDLKLGLLYGDEPVEQKQVRPKKPKIVFEELLPTLNIPIQHTRTDRQPSRPNHFEQYTS